MFLLQLFLFLSSIASLLNVNLHLELIVAEYLKTFSLQEQKVLFPLPTSRREVLVNLLFFPEVEALKAFPCFSILTLTTFFPLYERGIWVQLQFIRIETFVSDLFICSPLLLSAPVSVQQFYGCNYRNYYFGTTAKWHGDEWDSSCDVHQVSAEWTFHQKYCLL